MLEQATDYSIFLRENRMSAVLKANAVNKMMYLSTYIYTYICLRNVAIIQ